MKKFFLLPLAVLSLVTFNSCKEGDNEEEDATPKFTIGQSYQGGKIFYIDNTGNHGLIAATSDQSAGATWGCNSTDISATHATEIGSGDENTTAILNNCSTSGIAARVCDEYTGGGQSDWFLPSQLELHELYKQRSKIGGFSESFYYSSSSSSASSAYVEFFGEGSTPGSITDKSNSGKVRAIRKF